MTGIAKEIPRAGSAEAQNGGADFTLQLDSAELLTGTPTVVEQVTTDLTISSESINSAAVEINGDTVAIGKAVMFSVAGATAGVLYTLLVTAASDATPAQTLTWRVRRRGEA